MTARAMIFHRLTMSVPSLAHFAAQLSGRPRPFSVRLVPAVVRAEQSNTDSTADTNDKRRMVENHALPEHVRSHDLARTADLGGLRAGPEGSRHRFEGARNDGTCGPARQP